jgi:hypothetical protein
MIEVIVSGTSIIVLRTECLPWLPDLHTRYCHESGGQQ